MSSTNSASESPLKNTLYRFLWITMFASDIGAAMQTVGSGWLITSLVHSPFVVALLQVMTSLSIFLLALPAGALADIVDRRKLFLATQYFSLAVAAILTILTFGGFTTSSILVVFTLLLGLGNAMSLPVNIVIQTELVPKKKALAAMTLFSVAIYIGLAVGPLFGGLVVAAAGPWAVFMLNALSFVGIIVFLHRWRKPPERKLLPPEQVIEAIRTGLRYMRHSLHVRALFVRDFSLTICGSALVSLLPLLARNEAGSNSILFGILMGAFGIGGMISGLIIVPRIKKMSIEKRVKSATILYAVAMAVLAFQHNIIVVFIGVFAVGTALIIITSSLNFVAYNSVSSWVRTRVVSVHQLVYWGGVAIGSIIWGIVAEIWGIPTALLAASIGLIIGLVTSTRYKLKPLTDVDMTPSMHWPVPRAMIDIDDHEEGSVLVEMEFQIDPARSHEFESAMNKVRSVMLRDGAINWGLFHDVENPSRYVMMFASESWTEHLRQHERITKADLAIEQHAISFHIGKDPPRISHLISEDTSKQNHKTKKEDKV
ncbi:MAG TPA: MFS transporter [Nitrosopumilaceae archaeon]|nr:MFS transporter [Nitrosopumilaceae archaeon]